MIFANIKNDSRAMVGDMIRFNAGHSRTSDSSPIDKIEFRLSVEEDKILVCENFVGGMDAFIDWQFGVSGIFEPEFIFTQNEEETVKPCKVQILDEADAKLFSNDEMISRLEPDIFDLIQDGRSTFNHVHLMAQEKVIHELNELGHSLKPKYLYDIDEVSFWARYLSLVYIFEANITHKEDIHSEKRNRYLNLLESSKARVVVTLDKNQDGTPDEVIETVPTRLRLQ